VADAYTSFGGVAAGPQGRGFNTKRTKDTKFKATGEARGSQGLRFARSAMSAFAQALPIGLNFVSFVRFVLKI